MDIIRRRSIVLILFLVFLFSTQNYFFILSLGGTMNNIIICKPSERRALLSFKQHLNDSSTDSLSSWSGKNCCRWAGVVCSNTSDRVVQLQLQELGLKGELNPSLQELKQLSHLDLSFNDFQGISIPDFLGSLQSLRYLNLSSAGFSGMVPHQLGKLSNLRYLDLSSNYFYLKQLTVAAGNFQWISHLSSLQHLDLSGVNLTIASNWFHVVNMLPSLLALRLSNCALSGALPSSLSYVNFTSLQVLDLSFNHFNSTIPEWLYSLTNLEVLDLSQQVDLSEQHLHLNSFQGTISASIGNLTKLTLLDLSVNQIEGEIPTALGNLCKLRKLNLFSNKLKGEISGFLGSSIGCIASSSLEYLDLSSNRLSGPLPNDQLGRLQNLYYLSLQFNSFSGSIPFSIGKLTLLRHLDLRWNELNGSIPESFGNLLKLENLRLSYNVLEGNVSQGLLSNLTSLEEIELDSLVLKVRPEWIPSFQLKIARLRNCSLGPRFPNWLQTQKPLEQLDLSSNGISGTVPTGWFWNFSSQMSYLNLSYNHFIGGLPKVLNTGGIYLSFNQFNGPLPRLASSVVELDLSNNLFSDSISAFLCSPLAENFVLVLDLSNNLLFGDLSQCWFYWKSLTLVKLGSNHITGMIPSSMGSLLSLQSLHLENNNLSGELPLSLRNCTLLVTIDIGENVLTGRLPVWLGESFPYLMVLRLRRNKFHGEIPQKLCGMASLQMLDLAHNNLSGSIPRCFNNFSAMATKQNSSGRIIYSSLYVETTSLVTKGRESEYSNTLRLVTSMDLSNNSLSGEIPEELTSLLGLQSLNLSENRFTGKIPEKIGNMSSLESLDFSKNRISGVIPQSISGLSFLSYLNLSYNNLSGKIPLGTQLQSFNESSFIGNQDLCGLPLNKCNGDQKPPQKPDDIGDRAYGDEDWFEMKWFYMSMGVGFVFGFWVFCGVLVLKKSWRFAYFQFLDDMKDKVN